MLNIYLDSLRKFILKKIKIVINDQTIDDLVDHDLSFHLDQEESSSKFQKYYFKVTNNSDNFLHDPEFFKHFKYQYSLQGVDNNLLMRLESNKQEILDYLNSNRSFDVYDKFFSKVETKHGSKNLKKDFGSFFAKLAHTIKPDIYCALDNPIKNYFDLEKESFIVAFYLISQAYMDFSTDHKYCITELKKSFKKRDQKNIMTHDKLTDLKILDLIFWYRANVLTKGIR